MVSTFWNEIVLKQNREFVLVPFKSEHWGHYVSLCDYFKLPIHVSCVNKLPWEIISEKKCYAENSNDKWKLRLSTYSLDYFKNKSLSQLVNFSPKLDINDVECGILKLIRIKDDSLFFPFKNLPLEFSERSVLLYNKIKYILNFEGKKFSVIHWRRGDWVGKCVDSRYTKDINVTLNVFGSSDPVTRTLHYNPETNKFFEQ
jgi:hypothetical protein